MALTLTLSGNTSHLTADYFPPLDLDGGNDYVCGLIDLQTYNSIPNVDEQNNLFHIQDMEIEIPIGSYELDDLALFITGVLEELNSTTSLEIKANTNTMQCEIQSSEEINFKKHRSIGKLLGYSKRVLKAGQMHFSDLPIDINRVNVIRVECNITIGSFINNKPVHTIHEFSPEVGPGYKIIEVPKNVIYLPVNVKQISSLSLKLVDQDGYLINFRGETITIRLHLKPLRHAYL